MRYKVPLLAGLLFACGSPVPESEFDVVASLQTSATEVAPLHGSGTWFEVGTIDVVPGDPDEPTERVIVDADNPEPIVDDPAYMFADYETGKLYRVTYPDGFFAEPPVDPNLNPRGDDLSEATFLADEIGSWPIQRRRATPSSLRKLGVTATTTGLATTIVSTRVLG